MANPASGASPSAAAMLGDVDTPGLILDEARMLRNIARLADRLAPFDVTLRPHIKTAKSIDVTRRLLRDGHGPATVSTLRKPRRCSPPA